MPGAFGAGLNFSMGGSVRSGPRPVRMPRTGGNLGANTALARASDATNSMLRHGGGDAYREAANRPATVPDPSPDPYSGVGEDGDGSKPDVLPETNMGLKPDLTKANQLRQEYARKLEKRSPFMSAFLGVPQMHRTEDESYRARIEMAEQEAYREAAQRRAEANPWQSLPKDQIGARGERLERNWMTGEVRPMTYNEAFEEKVEKPVDAIPGYGTVMKRPADAPTWADQYAADPTTPQTAIVTERGVRRAPVRHERAVEIGLLGEKEAENDTRDAAAKRDELAIALANEMARIKAQGESQTATGIATARAHGEEARKNTAAVAAAGGYGPRGHDPNATPTGRETLLDMARRKVLDRMNFVDADDYKQNATPEQRAQYGKAMEKVEEELARQAAQEVSPEAGGLGQGALGGRRVGPVVSSSPGAKAPPKIGTKRTINGVTYVYKGGNAGDPKNWPVEGK